MIDFLFEQCIPWCRYCGVLFYEFPVYIAHTKKSSGVSVSSLVVSYLVRRLLILRSTCSSPVATMWTSYSISLCINKHLLSRSSMPSSRSIVRTCPMCLKCSVTFSAKKMSYYKYTMQKFDLDVAKMVPMARWKVSYAFRRPNVIRINYKSPYSVMQLVLCQ